MRLPCRCDDERAAQRRASGLPGLISCAHPHAACLACAGDGDGAAQHGAAPAQGRVGTEGELQLQRLLQFLR
jgi:hypothetical protein